MKGQRRESMEEEKEEERKSERQRRERAERAERRDVLRARPCGCGGSSSLSSSTDDYKDIISSLPDCLLIHILSFLPTRASVATSILSSRWRSLWKLVPVLDLDQRLLFTQSDTDYPGPTRTNSNFSFLDAVSNIWALRNAIPLSKLRLDWTSNCDSFLVDTWVQDTLLCGGLKELHLFILTGTNPPLEMPTTLFFSSTLVSLRLTGAILLNPPPASASTFPSLRTLALESVRYAKHDSISTLLAACPVLQDLSLSVETSNFQGLGESAGKVKVIVLVPTLKTLDILWPADECWLYKLQINTPALERFDFFGGLGEYVVLENLPNLVETVIELEDDDSVDYKNRIWDFMESLYNVVSMTFNLDTAMILCYGPMDGLPMFNNLTSLTFDGNIWPYFYMWPAVQLLLCQAPKVQTLGFELTFQGDYNGYQPDHRLENCMEKTLYDPECLSSHLTTCYYKGFSGHEVEMELVRQVLKEAYILKTMNITFESRLDTEIKLHACKKLRKLQRRFTGTNPPLEMPTTLFFSSTLVSLRLTGDILLNPPPASTFPSLRILVIGGVRYAKHNSISTLLAACPVLQDLILVVSSSNFNGLGESAGKVNVIVLIPTLKTLHVQWRAYDCWLYKLQINTPALEWFRFEGGLGEDVVLENLPNLVEAVIELDDDDSNSVDYAKRVLDFSRPLLNVQSLKLSIEDAEIFCNPYKYGIPMFHNLSSLMFFGEHRPDWCAWDVVQLMLCQAPKLQILALKLTLEYQSYHSDFKRHYHLKEEFYVPECLSSHLTTFYYKGFSGHGIEMELVRYVLKEAKVLKTMKIIVESNLGSKAKHCIHKKLMNFRRSSCTCQIEFDEGHLDLYMMRLL